MTMRVTPKVNVKGEAGADLVAGTTYTVSDAFGAALVGSGRAVDTDGALTPPGSEPARVNTNPLTGGNVLVAGGRQLNQVNGTPTTRSARIAAWTAGPIIVAPLRVNGATYVAGESVRLVDGTHLTCTVGGVAGGAEPTGYFDGRPITDGAVTWYASGWKKTASDTDAPTVTYSVSAAAAGLTTTKFATGTGPVQFLSSADVVPFNRTSGAFVGAVGYAPGNTSYSGNATGDVAAGSSVPVSISGEAYSFAQYDMEFFVNDSKFMLVMQTATQRLQVLIDGKPCFGSLVLQAGVNGSGFVFDFNGVHKNRRITICAVAAGQLPAGVALTAQGSLSAVPPTSDVMLLLGDSFCATIVPNLAEGHMGTYLKRYLGLGGMVNAGVGGSGYIAKVANSYNVGEVIASPSNRTLFDYLKPNHIFIHTVGNDRAGNSVAAIQSAALSTWQAIRARFPSAKITVTDGYSANGGPDATAIAVAAGVSATFAAWGDPNSRLIQEIGAGGSASFIWGAGGAGSALVAGNSSLFTSTDNVHPSPAGSRYLAARFAQAMYDAWGGDY